MLTTTPSDNPPNRNRPCCAGGWPALVGSRKPAAADLVPAVAVSAALRHVQHARRFVFNAAPSWTRPAKGLQGTGLRLPGLTCPMP